jgi:replication factor A2
LTHCISQITFVGQIRTISTQATNITYKLDDGTGLIEVKQWIDSDAPAETANPPLQENTYVRVYGRLKPFNNKRHVGAHVVRPITDFNEINMHLLEATYVHLYFTRGPPEGLQGAGGGGGNAMFVEPSGYGGAANAATSARGKPLPHMSATAKRVFNQLQSAQLNNEGLHVQNIAAQLGLPTNDVFKAGDELLGLGIIFTTVDDETWAVLEF